MPILNPSSHFYFLSYWIDKDLWLQVEQLCQGQPCSGVPIVAQWKWIWLVSWGRRFGPWPHSGDQRSCIAVSHGVGRRSGSDPTLLWLWCRPVATAPIWPLDWEPPYSMGVALKEKKKLIKKKNRHIHSIPDFTADTSVIDHNVGGSFFVDLFST